MPLQAPRIFCAATGEGEDAEGYHKPASCTCVTEQGTRYALPENHCRMTAREGQYEPFRDEVIGDRRRLDDNTQRRQLQEHEASRVAGPSTFEPGSVITADQSAATAISRWARHHDRRVWAQPTETAVIGRQAGQVDRLGG